MRMILPAVPTRPLLAALGVLLSAGFASAVVTHQYRLDGSYAADLGGPDLTPEGGVLSATGYAFGPNEGLALAGAIADPTNYSIEMKFRLDEVAGYRKLIDFKDRADDTGLYTLNGSFGVYDLPFGPPGSFAVGVDARMVLTRDGITEEVIGYVNGDPMFQFIDSGDLAVFTTAGALARFLQDDFAVQGEASAGVVDYIRLYDTPLSPTEVRDLADPTIPEPTGAVLATLAAAIAMRRRRSVC